MLKSSSCRSNRVAFTLIELLVVIAIIAILAAILFPVFAQAREKARAISCLSNLKQIGLGMMMYVQDYDEKLPMAQYGVGDTQVAWEAAIYPYIKNDQGTVNKNSGLLQAWGSSGIFRCPSFGDVQSSMYGVHLDLFADNWNGGTRPTVSIAGIDAPADKIMVAEKGRNQGSWGWQYFSTWQWDCADGVKTDGKIDDSKDNTNIAVGKYDKNKGDCDGAANADAVWAGCGMQPRYRHNGTSNFVFLDGHAKAINKGQLKWYKNIYVPFGQAADWTSQGWYPY